MLKDKLKGIAIGAAATALIFTSVPAIAEKTSKTAELIYNDIKVVINGKQAELKDANGNPVEPFIVNGTTYLPVRAVANALDKAVSWDGKTKTVYLGKNEQIAQPSVWLKDLETFKGSVTARTVDEIEFGGSTYNNYLTANTGDVYNNFWYPNDDSVSYLLDYKYSSFKGTFYLSKGYKDDTTPYRFLVYGDDKLIYTSPSMKSESRPVAFNVDVSDVGVLKIAYQYNNRSDGSGDWRSPSFCYYTPIGNAGLYE